MKISVVTCLLFLASQGAFAFLVSSTLPASRSVQTGATASVFGTVINGGSATATNCRVELGTSIDATFSYQRTDPLTNAVIGNPDTPVDIPAGQAQSFVMFLTGNSEIPPTDVAFNFICDNDGPTTAVPGLNTLLFSSSDAPVPDVIALAATFTGDGIVDMPLDNVFGFFSVASINLGASATIRVSATATGASVSNALICETNPATAVCISDILPTVDTVVAAGDTPTFSVFVSSSQAVTFDPAGNRLAVTFSDANDVVRGSTSVAIRGGGSSSSPAMAAFTNNISEQIIQTKCIFCHVTGSAAGNTSLVFTSAGSDSNHLSNNYDVFQSYLNSAVDGVNQILNKVRGVSHGGGTQLASSTGEYTNLSDFLGLLAASGTSSSPALDAFTADISETIIQTTCIACHVSGSAAGGTELVFTSAGSDSGHLAINYAVFESYLASGSDGVNQILNKVRGVGHGGGTQLASSSSEYANLSNFLDLLAASGTSAPPSTDEPTTPPVAGSVFTNVVMGASASTLQRAAIILSGTLPSATEKTTVTNGGDSALRTALRDLMQGDGFHAFLIEGGNDRLLTDKFLTEGIFDTFEAKYVPYTNISHDLQVQAEMNADESIRWQWESRHNYALARAPLELIAYVAENDRPYTEILTANYMMVNPWSNASVGGNAVFVDSENVQEFKPAITGSYYRDDDSKIVDFDRDAGPYVLDPGNLITDYPHAGILNTPAFLLRYPTTATNRNRARARWTFKHFLGLDIEKSAARTTDPVALADTDNPTMNNENCTVCHSVMDPMAGAFQNYGDRGLYRDQYLGLDSLPDTYRYPEEGTTTEYQQGDTWYRDMRTPGFGDATAPDPEKSLQWLAEQIVQDERFARAAVEFWWPAVMGVEMMQAPEVSSDAGFAEKLLAYESQQETIQLLADGFRSGTTSNGVYNLRDLLVELIMTPWFRAGSGSDAADLSGQEVALADAGVGRLLTPEQLARKTSAITGFSWGNRFDAYLLSNNNNLSEQYRLYYGGLDSDGIVSRSEDVTPLMAAVAQSHALESACPIIMHEYLLPDGERHLFSGVDRNTTPVTNPDAIKQQLIRLHELMLGEQLSLSSPELERSYQLLVDVWQSKQSDNNDYFPADYPCNWWQDDDFYNGLVTSPRTLTEGGWYEFNNVAIQAFLDTQDRSDSNHMLKTWVAMMVYFMTDYRYLYI